MWPDTIRKLDRLNDHLDQILPKFEKMGQHVMRTADWINAKLGMRVGAIERSAEVMHWMLMSTLAKGMPE
jgi:hypothetical protein